MSEQAQPENQYTPREKFEMLMWLWRTHARKHVWWMALGVLLMALEGSVIGGMSYMVQPMIDSIFVQKDTSAMPWIALVVCLLFIVRGTSGMLQKLIMTSVSAKVSTHLQMDLFRHQLALDSAYFMGKTPGEFLERTMGDASRVQALWTSVLISLIRDIITLLALLYVVTRIDWVWTLIALAALPVLPLPIILVRVCTRELARWQIILGERVFNRVSGTFLLIDTAKLYNLLKPIGERFDELVKKLRLINIKMTACTSFPTMSADWIAGFCFVGVLFYGGREIINDEKTVGEFMSFFTAMVLVFDPVRKLSKVPLDWEIASVSLCRIKTTLAQKATILDGGVPLPNLGRGGRIEFQGVWFSYDPDVKPDADLESSCALRGVSFVAEEGKTTAIVGLSGAGKSTIFKLATRLGDPLMGSVELNGKSIKEYRISDLRSAFAVVSQDPNLFDDETVYKNIRAERPAAEKEKIRDAAKRAQIDISLSTKAKSLSGGQRQRVSIARAFLRDAPLLMLDEPTSSLDATTEDNLLKTLKSLSKNRTTLVIAHRFSTIRHADKIIVLHEGRIAETGNHASLMRAKGLYASLYRLQNRKV